MSIEGEGFSIEHMLQINFTDSSGLPYDLTECQENNFTISFKQTKNYKKLTAKRANGTKPSIRKRRISNRGYNRSFQGVITDAKNGQFTIKVKGV